MVFSPPPPSKIHKVSLINLLTSAIPHPTPLPPLPPPKEKKIHKQTDSTHKILKKKSID